MIDEFSPNPAQRLYNLIKKLEPYFHNHQNKQVLEIWAKVFDSPQDEQEITKAFQSCHKLIDNIEDLLKNNERTNKQRFLAPIKRSRKLFSFRHIYYFPNIVGDNVFNSGDQTALDFCIDAIDELPLEKVIDGEELGEIVEEIKNLYSKIKESDIEKKLRDLLLDLLKVMENSIHEYEIRGIKSVEEAVAEVLGKLLINQDLIRNSKEEIKEFSSFWSKFFSVWAKAADSVQLLDAGTKYLPLLLVAAEHINK